MSSPENKTSTKEQPSPTPQSTSNPSLPNDLLLSCFACISRLYYPTLSVVSKSFRSLLTSPELYKVRDHTDTCMYVCIQFFSEPRPSWYTLCRKPNQTQTKSASGYVLAKVPVPNSPRAFFKSLVSVGPNIYNIGEPVSVLDCRSHTWSEAPSMRFELSSLSASVLDRKIYVAGRCRDCKNSLQVFDTETQTWDSVAIGFEDRFYNKTSSVDKKFHVVASDSRMGWYMELSAYCEIDNVLHSAFGGVLRWYDTKGGTWRTLKGLKGLPKLTRESRVRLAGYGGKMWVLWNQYFYYYNRFSPPKKMIWCAEISLEMRYGCEIWGTVEWFDHVQDVM